VNTYLLTSLCEGKQQYKDTMPTKTQKNSTTNKVSFRSTKRRRGKSPKLSFVKKKGEKRYRSEDAEEEEEYQSVIRNNVGYRKRKLTRGQEITLDYVKKYYDIPEHFDRDKRFGPLSGSSPELRIISAYVEGSLNVKKGKKKVIKVICHECGTIGHDSMNCDQLC